MKPTIDHVILTRFNLPTAGVESLVRAQEGWLRDRQALFEKYCLPSVKLQTHQNFSWIIYFDTQSPSWLKNRVSELGASGEFFAIYRDSVSPAELIEDIRSIGAGESDVLLTTNLDNDDGLALDFVERLQDSVVDGARTALYFPAGLIQQGERLFLRHDPDNAFCSVSENWKDPRTCWTDWHNLLGKHMPVVELDGGPGWLQVIHSGNVSNRVRGTRVAANNYRTGFVGGFKEIAEPNTTAMFGERYVQAPMRWLRESARATAKKLTLLVGGKETLDRVKVSVSMRGNFRK